MVKRNRVQVCSDITTEHAQWDREHGMADSKHRRWTRKALWKTNQRNHDYVSRPDPQWIIRLLHNELPLHTINDNPSRQPSNHVTIATELALVPNGRLVQYTRSRNLRLVISDRPRLGNHIILQEGSATSRSHNQRDPQQPHNIPRQLQNIIDHHR